jgi:hypothetical protein
MTNCHEMRNGETYHCPDCGLELQVVKECRDVGKPAEDCGCHKEDTSSDQACTLTCCGKPLVKK